MFEFETALPSKRFIQDITPTERARYFNSRNDRVRAHSIGYLDAKYKQLKGASQPKAIDMVKPTPFKHGLSYTRIPPLTVLQQQRDDSVIDKVLENSELFYGVVSSAGITAGQTIRSLPWLPKKYQMNRGVYTDFNTQTFKQARWSLPILLVAGGLLFASMPWNVPTVQPGTKPKTGGNATVQAQLVNAKLTDKPTSTNEGDSATPTATVPRKYTTPSATSTTVGPVTIPENPKEVIGGIGGGEPVVDVPQVLAPTTPPADPILDPILPAPIDQVITDVTAPVTNIL